MTIARDIISLERRVTQIEGRAVRIPLRDLPGPRVQRVQIIGGNLLTSGHQAIKYAATVTLTQAYDPDVDTVYDAGLGNAWLFVNGIKQSNRVLVRHSFEGYTQPLLAGRIMSSPGVSAVTFGGTTMAAYLLDLP